jgi:hypothetical protein
VKNVVIIEAFIMQSKLQPIGGSLEQSTKKIIKKDRFF